jgi:flagellar protein FlbT
MGEFVMPLKIYIKDNESFFVGGAALKNVSGQSIELLVVNKVPILRGAAILKPEDADTPVKRVYFEIQNMYMFGVTEEKFHNLARLLSDLVKAAPSLSDDIIQITMAVQGRDIYPALKKTEELLEKEQRMLAESHSWSAPAMDAPEA